MKLIEPTFDAVTDNLAAVDDVDPQLQCLGRLSMN